jgi:hypothetical protein
MYYSALYSQTTAKPVFSHGTGLSAAESQVIAFHAQNQVPDVLRGVCVAEKATPSARTLRLIERANKANARALERADREARKAELRAAKAAEREAAKRAKITERELTDLRSEGIVVEWEGDVAEVVSLLVDPAYGPGVWVRLAMAEGGFQDVHEDRWAELGDDVETALMIAYDRIPVGAILV